MRIHIDLLPADNEQIQARVIEVKPVGKSISNFYVGLAFSIIVFSAEGQPRCSQDVSVGESIIEEDKTKVGCEFLNIILCVFIS